MNLLRPSLLALPLFAFSLSVACGQILEDPTACGTAKTDCLGATCTDGVCAPLALASGIDKPVALAVDDTHVVWIDAASHVGMVPKRGGTVTQLATLPAGAMSIASDDAAAYVAIFTARPDGGIYRVPFDGTPPALFDAMPNATSVRVDHDRCIVWTGLGSSTQPAAIWRKCPSSSKSEVTRETVGGTVAAGATTTFWSGPPPILGSACSQKPSPVLRLVDGKAEVIGEGHLSTQNSALASAGDVLFWRDLCSGVVYRWQRGSSATALGTIADRPGSGGYDYAYTPITADAHGAYTSTKTSVVFVPGDGRAVRPLLDQEAVDLAVDGRRIFALTTSGSVIAVLAPSE